MSSYNQQNNMYQAQGQIQIDCYSNTSLLQNHSPKLKFEESYNYDSYEDNYNQKQVDIIYEPEYFFNTQQEEQDINHYSKENNQNEMTMQNSCFNNIFNNFNDTFTNLNENQYNNKNYNYNINNHNTYFNNKINNLQHIENQQLQNLNCPYQQKINQIQQLPSQMLSLLQDCGKQQIKSSLTKFDQFRSESEFQSSQQTQQQSSQVISNFSDEEFHTNQKETKLINLEKNIINQCSLLEINSFEQGDDNDSDQSNETKQRNQNHLKNIFNAFKGYMKKLKKCDILDISAYEFSNLKKQLMRYMKLHSFNHSQLKYIVNHKFYKLLLLFFLQNESQNWINTSKVQNKEEIQKKVTFLTECIKAPSLLDSFNTYQTNKFKKEKL